MIFFEGVPGVVQYKYFDASDGGISCTVGVQGNKIKIKKRCFSLYIECSHLLDSSSGPFIQYSFDLANAIQPNTTMIFDTNLGIYTNATF